MIEINGKKVEVAEKDLSGLMNWANANKAISDLGPEWRVPTLKVLEEIYKEREYCMKYFKFNFNSHLYCRALITINDNESEDKAALYFSPYEPDSLAGYFKDFKKEIASCYMVKHISSDNT